MGSSGALTVHHVLLSVAAPGGVFEELSISKRTLPTVTFPFPNDLLCANGTGTERLKVLLAYSISITGLWTRNRKTLPNWPSLKEGQQEEEAEEK